MSVVAFATVHYADDFDQKAFRCVYQLDTDPAGTLDDPRWITDNVDPLRIAVLTKFAQGAVVPPLVGTPGAPPTTNGIDPLGNPWPPLVAVV